MSTAGGRTRPKWKVWALVPALVVVVLAGLLHAWRNTNLLTEDRLCGGLVSAAQADAVLPGSGRLHAEGDGLDDDLTDTVCGIEKSSVLLGSAKSFMTVDVQEEQAEDFLSIDWSPDLSTTSFFSGATTGGVGTYTGWALLPEKCWTGPPLIVRVSTSKPVRDRTAFATLTTNAAREVAARADCGDLPEKPEAFLPPRPGAARPVSEGEVCGLDGLSVSAQAPKRARVLEQGQKAPAALWSCKLVLDDDSRGFIRADGFMTYVASRDPLLIAAVRKAPDTVEGRAPDGRKADVVKPWGMVLSCAEGGPLYVQSQSGLQYMDSRDRGADLPPRDAYFAAFTKAAAKTFDCAAPTGG